jgi:hypothetical protein
MSDEAATSGQEVRSQRRRRWTAVALAAILVAAFGARLGAGLWIQATHRDELADQLGDSRGYRELADHVLAGRGLVMTDLEVGPSPRYADRMPGYPLILAALKAACGENERSLLVLQALAGAATTWLAWRLGCEVHSPTAGLVAALGTALAAWQVAFAAVTLTECWSGLLLAATLLCVVRAVRRRSPAWAATAGLAAAALVYVHPEYLGLPAALAVVALVAPGRRRWLGYWAAGVLVLAAALAPWWIRNASTLGRFVPTTTRLGVSLYDGVHDRATGGSDMTFERELSVETAGLDEVAYDRWYRERSSCIIGDEPGRVAALAWSKLRRTWSAAPSGERGGRWVRWASVASYVPMLGGVLLAVGLMRRRPMLVVLVVPIVYVTAVHLVMVGSIRYRVPVEPLAWVLAGVAAAWVVTGTAPANGNSGGRQ